MSNDQIVPITGHDETRLVYNQFTWCCGEPKFGWLNWPAGGDQGLLAWCSGGDLMSCAGDGPGIWWYPPVFL